MELHDNWEDAKAKLNFWKAKELELRNEILEESAGKKDEGVVHKYIDNLDIACTYALSRKVDEPVLDSIWDELSDIEKACIKYKPEVVLKEFRKLEEVGESTLLDAVVIKPGQGAVKIKHVTN